MIQKLDRALQKLFGGEYTWQRVFLICFAAAGLLYLPWVILDGGLEYSVG